MNNKKVNFWLTFFSLLSMFCTGVGTLFLSIFADEENVIRLTFRKEWLLLMIPFIVYNIFQFIVNYINLTEDD